MPSVLPSSLFRSWGRRLRRSTAAGAAQRLLAVCTAIFPAVVAALVAVHAPGDGVRIARGDEPSTGDERPATRRSLGAQAHVTARMLNEFFARDVSDRRTVEGYISGAYATGQASTVGRLVARMTPDVERAAIDLHLVGVTTLSDQVASQRSVRVYSSGQTDVDAHKQVLVDSTGIHPQPATARCRAEIQVHAIDAPRRFVERLAWRKVDRGRDEMRQQAAEQAETRSAEQLDQQANELLAKADTLYREKVLDPLADRGVALSDWRFASGDEALHFLASHEADSRRSERFRPSTLSLRHDVALAAQETWIEQLFASLMGGRTATDRQFLDLMNLLTGDTPRALWVHDRAERWDATFARRDPLSLTLAEDRIALKVRLAQLRRGERRYDRPIEIGADYRLVIESKRPQLVREGDLRVVFPDGADDVALRRFVTRKFGGVFQPTLGFEGFVPPAGGTWGKLRHLEAEVWRADHGWLALGYRLRAEPERP